MLNEEDSTLECAQLLATLADTMTDDVHDDDDVQPPGSKGPRAPRRAIKRMLSIDHLVDVVEPHPDVPSSPYTSSPPHPSGPSGAIYSHDDDHHARASASPSPLTRQEGARQEGARQEGPRQEGPRQEGGSQEGPPVKRPRRVASHMSGIQQHRSKRTETGKRWTFEETEAFLAGVEMYGVGNWQKVHDACASLFGQRRTTVDLKDKWRNLVKAVSTPGLIPRSVRLTPEQKQRILLCIQAKDAEA